MLDIKFVRTNPDVVKENIKKKFQEEKLPLVDEVIDLDRRYREAKTRCDYLRSQRNTISKQIGGMMAKGQKEEAEPRPRRRSPRWPGSWRTSRSRRRCSKGRSKSG